MSEEACSTSSVVILPLLSKGPGYAPMRKARPIGRLPARKACQSMGTRMICGRFACQVTSALSATKRLNDEACCARLSRTAAFHVRCQT